jgi:non-lysosomal glucosylceramidase
MCGKKLYFFYFPCTFSMFLLGQIAKLACMKYGAFNIPEFAFKRPIGLYPKGATGNMAPLEDTVKEGDLPVSCRTKRGIPLGGIGCGSLMFNLSGSFGPWNFDIGGDDAPGSSWGKEDHCGHEERFLKGAGFHFYCEALGGISLITEDYLTGFNTLKAGQGFYYALFPKSWFIYDISPDVTLLCEQITPYVANDDFWLSNPVGLFRFYVKNNTDKTTRISLAFSWPNAGYREESFYDYKREGLQSEKVISDDFIAIRLQAKDSQNVAETKNSEWVIASKKANAEFTYNLAWDPESDGQQLIGNFYKTGKLLNEDNLTGKAGAIAVLCELKAGESEIIPFALSWDFPVVQFKNPREGTCWKKRYTEFFNGEFKGLDIAKNALDKEQELIEKIDAWWLKILNAKEHPDWLKMAALNELYYDVFGSSFWENGCISKEKKFGKRPNQHLSFVIECNSYRDCETMDLHYYEGRHRTFLTRSIERDLLLGWADMIMDEPEGRTPHDAGSPVADPWFKYGQYFATAPNLEPITISWRDQPSRFVQMAHSFYSETLDREFLIDIFPALERTMAHLQTLDTDNDMIPECVGFDTSYDGLGLRGITCHVATLAIGAYLALADLAKILGHDEKSSYYANCAKKARSKTENTLWDAERGYYKAATIGELKDALMADALCGQRYCGLYNLPDVLDPHRMISHLKNVYRYNVLGCDNGLKGAQNLYSFSGLKLPQMGQGIWPGGTYFTAALMYNLAKRFNDKELEDAALKTAYGVVYSTYFDEEMAFWFNTPAIWYPWNPPRFRSQQNARPRAVWELFFEIGNPLAGIRNSEPA